MSKLMAVLLSLVFVVTASLALAEGTAESTLKAGSSVYACGCGEGCKCGTLSNKAGKCGCGKPLVKTSVTKVEDGKAFYQMNGKQMSAAVKGAYVCACGEACNCNTVSQKAGNCGCGKPLKKVEQ